MMTWKRVLTVMAGLLAVGRLPVCAQVARLPSFDVVSVRVNDTGEHGYGIDVEKNSFTANNVTLLNLIAEAYGIKNDLVSNAPGWMNSVHYDVKAKVLDGDNVDLEKYTDRERGPILQAVLAERFQLKMHSETKTLPVYELVIAKGGAKLKPTPVVEGGTEKPHDGTYSVYHGSLDGHGMTLANVAATLTDVVRRKVIDKTGLTGGYDVSLKWTPEEDAKDTGVTDAPPPIFTALQEQLGLKLQAGKGPVETLVVDHAEKPTEN